MCLARRKPKTSLFTSGVSGIRSRSRELKENKRTIREGDYKTEHASSSARDTAQHMQVSEQHQQYVVAAYHARFAGLWNEGSQGAR
mmetsp:Transcript_18469/g.27103  ORF Transcript_18469/g.27103 Transcript_18469/m.27103 type:complete len:86 (+) Transcript_18469:748-1005(+)